MKFIRDLKEGDRISDIQELFQPGIPDAVHHVQKLRVHLVVVL